MRNRLLARYVVAISALVILGSARSVQGQAPAPKPVIPVKIDIVLSRYQGDKKVSSLPFMVWANGGQNERCSVRIGVDVPIGATTETRNNSNQGGTSGTATTTTRPEYRNIGTSIDCSASPQDDGRFVVWVNLTDSSIYAPEAERLTTLAQRGLAPTRPATPLAKADPSAFQTFSLSNRLSMKDGQTLQFAAATDKISGETLKVDVTIAVLK